MRRPWRCTMSPCGSMSGWASGESTSAEMPAGSTPWADGVLVGNVTTAVYSWRRRRVLVRSSDGRVTGGVPRGGAGGRPAVAAGVLGVRARDVSRPGADDVPPDPDVQVRAVVPGRLRDVHGREGPLRRPRHRLRPRRADPAGDTGRPRRQGECGREVHERGR